MNERKTGLFKKGELADKPARLLTQPIDRTTSDVTRQNVIKDVSDMSGVEKISNSAVAKWYGDHGEKIPAIVARDGTMYIVCKEDRLAAEAKGYHQLQAIVRKELDYEPRQREVTRVVLESAIRRLKPEEIKRASEEGDKLIRSLVTRGINMNATDMHLHGVGRDAKIKYRVYGRVLEDQQFDSDQAENIITALFQYYIKGQHDSSPARKGSFRMYVKRKDEFDREGDAEQWMCRASFGRSDETRTIKLVIRFRNMEDIPSIQTLGYHPEQLRDILMAVQNRGFTLFMGAVNSGKSTSQAGFMMLRPQDAINLEISAETEIFFPHFAQLVLPTQGPPEKIPEFRQRMINLPMQQDCDFLAINELNTPETADMAARMMMQGTSGVSSVHGAGWGDVINRLKSQTDLGISEQILFSDSFFNMLVYQTLVGRLCPDCCKSEAPMMAWEKQLKEWFGAKARRFRFHNPSGCEKCNGLGVVERELVAEVIPINQENRHLLRTPEDSQPMREWMFKTGRMTIHQHAYHKAMMGKIDPIQVMAKIGWFSRHNLGGELINDKPDADKFQEEMEAASGEPRLVE